MSVVVEPEIWTRFAGMQLVVVLGQGLDNQALRPSLQAQGTQLQERVRAQWRYANAQSHPQIAAWRQVMKQMGLSPKKHASAIEALTRRVLSGKALPSINPLVDLYNMVSVAHTVPIGGWDLDGVAGGSIRLTCTRGGESFTELGSTTPVAVAAGEIAYTDDEVLVTRHFVWRQAERGKVTPATRRFVLISEILPGFDPALPLQVQHALVQALHEHLGVQAEATLVSAPDARPTVVAERPSQL
ncbi:MAG: B3/4 domain-containing protein [Polyangiales bacterium]